MSRLTTVSVTLLTFLAPSAAGAAVIASSSLDSGPVTVTFSHDVSDTSGELFSTASAALGPDGVATSDNSPLPGVADAPTATDGTMSADSFFSVQPDDDISFMSEASGSLPTGGGFGSAIGEVTGSFEFTNPEDGLSLTIVTELTRMFDLSTETGLELASAATSLSLALLNDIAFLPMVTLSNPDCAPNAAFSVSNGDAFSDSCTTMATFLFENLPEGDYTLTFASNSSIDVVSEIPVPAAAGLFGLGMTALGWKTRRRKKTTA